MKKSIYLFIVLLLPTQVFSSKIIFINPQEIETIKDWEGMKLNKKEPLELESIDYMVLKNGQILPFEYLDQSNYIDLKQLLLGAHMDPGGTSGGGGG